MFFSALHEITAEKIKDAHVRIFPEYTYDPTRKRKLLEGKVKISPKICKRKKEDLAVEIADSVNFLIPRIEEIKYEIEGSSLLNDLNSPATQTQEFDNFASVYKLEPCPSIHHPAVGYEYAQNSPLNNVKNIHELPIDPQPGA